MNAGSAPLYETGLVFEDHLREERLADRILARELAAPDPGPVSPDWARPEGRRDMIPDDLADAPAATALAMLVLTVDRSRLSAYDLVHLLRAEDRLVSMVQGRRYRTIQQINALYGDRDSAAAEIGAALHLTRAASRAEVQTADQLAEHPRVQHLLDSGAIDLRRTRVLLEGVAGQDRQVAEQAVDLVSPEAPDLTTGELRARLSRVCAELDPDSLQRRYDEGVAQRRVVLTANPDTTANLMGLDLPPDLAAAAAKRIDWLARKARVEGDDRNLDQVRADVFLDLLTGRGRTGRNAAPSGHVDIDADIRTLTGESQTPGHIPGFGPVIAEVAREVVTRQTDCRWEYTVTDQGRPVATGTIRRRPTEGMRRHIRAMHPTCVWPGCRMPARQSDLDHRTPWSHGGPTSLRNLAPLCDFHHALLDKGWSYEPAPEGGFVFISPLGHTYISSGRAP